MRRQDVIRVLVVACVTLAALGILVPAKAPAVSPMGVTVTTWYTTTFAGFGSYNFTFTLTFSNVTTSMTSTSWIASTTIWYPSFTTFLVTTTVSTSQTTTVTTYRTTKTLGTTTVPSTFTQLSTVTGVTTNRTITTTASETVTSTSHTTQLLTTTSTYTATGVNPPTPPPIPGFPLESILAGLALGLLGVHLIYRKRRANGKRSA